MDPRHPEQAVVRLRELMKQYDRIESDITRATVSSKLGQLEREGGLVVQEMCLVAPRIHEAMMQASRQRRYELSHGVAEKPVEKDINKIEKKVDIEELDVNEKPKKKTTRKKKTTKKVDK